MISVIIPAYNSEKALKRCINSILSQSYKDFEIIIIDDGSNDKTNEVAQNYKDRFTNIRLITNPKNVGPFKSRIIGVDNSLGEYVTFIDSDDTFQPLALQKLYDGIEDADISVAGMQYRFTRFELPKKMHYSMPSVLCKDELKKALISFMGVEDLIPVQVWGKLYQKKLLKSISYPNYTQIWGDDRIFNLLVFSQATKVKRVDYIGYNYYWGGCTTVYKADDYAKYDYFYSFVEKIACGLGLQDFMPTLQSKINDFFLYSIRNSIAYLRLSKDEIVSIIQERNKISFTEAESIYLEQYKIVSRKRLLYWLKKHL